jgi:riboflavin kinase/FMN adenylyltransferase
MTAVYQDIRSIPDTVKGSVLTIGNFDGVHPGHLSLVLRAQQRGARVAVLTFEPHPREFFQKDAEPFRLTLLPMKARLMAFAGVNTLIAVPFDAAFAQLPAHEFIAFLKDKIDPSHIVIGADFHFGRGRAGDVALLAKHFPVTVVDPVLCPDGTAYSSTRIREHLRAGELDAAAALLGRRFEIESTVQHGDKRGRTLGYPTANQHLERYVRMVFGIYAVEVRVGDDPAVHYGVSSYGVRPMFRVTEPLLETYIFDFDRDIYGRNLRVTPLKYLRPEKNFDGLPALVAQIEEDCAEARQYIAAGRGKA